MYQNEEYSIDEENVKAFQKTFNEIKKAYGDQFVMSYPNLVGMISIASSINRLTEVLHNDMKELTGLLSDLKTEGNPPQN